jgi:hypothetical protein
MNCNIFKKRLENYILGDISEDLKSSLEKHMEQCESCRSLYDEEVKIDTDFKTVLSIEGIKFNSSRTNIINSIDKNRYSKKASNKIFYSFRRHKSKYLSYAVAAIAMLVFIPMMLRGITMGNHKSESMNKDTAIYKSSEPGVTERKVTTEGATYEDSLLKEDIKEDNNITSAKQDEMSKLLQFQSSIVAKEALPAYKIIWETSTDDKNSAAIDIGEERDVDFGIHVIYVKDMSTNKIVKYEITNNVMQFTPRNIEWWDNEHLIIVAGYAYGTIAQGSQVYSLDINTGDISLLYRIKDVKQQIVEVSRVKNDLMLELKIYNDDTLNEFHSGVGKMTLLELDKLVDMKIESEEKN